jgi:AAA family ATP:ADP antiporter
MNESKPKEFGRIRAALFPVYRHEIKKLIPMFILMFFICFNYTVLRNLKDALVLTAKHSGSEVIPAIKLYVMFPAAILGVLLYTKLSQHYSQERVFYLIVSGFFLFFGLFAFVIYPNVEYLHPVDSVVFLQEHLPTGFKGIIAMYGNWTFTLFYLFAELWACLVLNVLFWGFANQVMSLGEAMRFYSIFHIGSNIGTCVASLVSISVTNWIHKSHGVVQVQDEFGQLLTYLLPIVVFSCIAIMMMFRWINSHVSLDPWVHQAPKRKKKHSLRESFAYLTQSKYLLCIAVMVISYNLFTNCVEVIWKDRLRELYPNTIDLNNYLNVISLLTGTLSVGMALIMPWVIKKKGWCFTAMITPIVTLLTSAGFFFFLINQDTLAYPIATLIGGTSLGIVVFFGGLHNTLTKAGKYSVFDVTKEMSFIPLDHEVKQNGKAVIDGVGSRLGKSGASLVQNILLLFYSSLISCVPIIAAVLFIVIIAWFMAVRSLNKQFTTLNSSKETEPSPETGDYIDGDLVGAPA